MTGIVSRYLFIINGAALLGCAIFDFVWRDTLLVALMLFLPFIDGYWSVPRLKGYKYQLSLWFALIGVVVFILVIKPGEFNLILYTLLLVALPEEWFFRVYFMTRVETLSGNKWTANIATSTLFAILHVPTQGGAGLMVFVPSLILGWIYQQRRDLVLVILLHALSNLVFLMYLHKWSEYLAETS